MAPKDSEKDVAKDGFLDPSGEEEEMYQGLDKIAHLKNIIDNYPGYELPEIPQIIVCGSQSSGKSSVLENLTGIAFPRKIRLCTRYPTKVTIERSKENLVQVDINTPVGRSKDEAKLLNIGIPEKIKWEDWERNGTSIVERWVTLANDYILGPDWDGKDIWAKDVLSITLKNEKKRPLQVVDLPGLFFHTVGQPTAMNDVVEVVTNEMQKPNCVILAVVDGSDDRNKHQILDYCKRFDPDGERTVVVVTKLDIADDKSAGGRAKAQEYIDIINGQNPAYKQRWHALRNRRQEELEQKSSSAALKAKETEFFAQDFWKTILPERRGIEELENLLRSMLHARIQRFLPEIKARLEKDLAEAENELHAIVGNISKIEIDQFFTAMFNYQREQMIMDKYSKTRQNSDHLVPTHCAFIRARIEDQKLAFGNCIRNGGSILLTLSSAQNGPNSDPDSDIKTLPAVGLKLGGEYETELAQRCEAKHSEHKTEDQDKQNTLTNIHWLNRPGLPGSVNPDIMNRLIRQETAKWPSLVENLITHVDKTCNEYLIKGLLETCRGFKKKKVEYAVVYDRFHKHWPEFCQKYLLPGLELRKQKAIAEAKRMDDDREEDIYEYDPRFIIELRQYRNTIHKTAHEAAYKKFRTASEKGEEIAPDAIAKESKLHTQEDWTESYVKEFIESKKIHYNLAITRFIQNVCVQVIERHFMRDLQELVPDVRKLDQSEMEYFIRGNPGDEKKAQGLKTTILAIEECLKVLMTK